jgi:energy-coupling factor transporter transmembrane protein EcfT
LADLEIIRERYAVFPLKLKDWVLLAGIAACSVVWFAVGDALRALY